MLLPLKRKISHKQEKRLCLKGVSSKCSRTAKAPLGLQLLEASKRHRKISCSSVLTKTAATYSSSQWAHLKQGKWLFLCRIGQKLNFQAASFLHLVTLSDDSGLFPTYAYCKLGKTGLWSGWRLILWKKDAQFYGLAWHTRDQLTSRFLAQDLTLDKRSVTCPFWCGHNQSLDFSNLYARGMKRSD